MKLIDFRKLMLNKNNIKLEHNRTDLKITVGVTSREENRLITEVIVIGEIEWFGRIKKIDETYDLRNSESRKDFQILIEDYLQGGEDWM